EPRALPAADGLGGFGRRDARRAPGVAGRRGPGDDPGRSGQPRRRSRPAAPRPRPVAEPGRRGREYGTCGCWHARRRACFTGGAARGLLDAGRGAGPVARGAAGFGWRAWPGFGWLGPGWAALRVRAGWQVVRWLWRAWRPLQVVRSSSRLSWWIRA